MRQLFCKDDVQSLVGTFMIQLNFDQENIDITKSVNPNFWFEKRVNFLTINGNHMIFNGLFYTFNELPIEEALQRINGENGKRFMRLMTKKELQWLMNMLIIKNEQNKLI